MANFKEAFAAARGAKKATFDWNGKSYSTQLKGEPAGMTKGPKARPEPAGAQRPKARPANKGPSVMSEAPKQGNAPRTEPSPTTTSATPLRKAAGTPFAASRTNPKVTPLGKSTGIGGRAAEAVKGLVGALRGKPAAKPKTAFKTPNRATVGKKK